MMVRRGVPGAPIIFLGLLTAFVPQPVTVQGAPEIVIPVSLRVETLRVGPGGTETLSADEARLLPGKVALLKKEVSLDAPPARRKGSERISLRAEIRVESSSPTRLVVTVLSRVNVIATTGGIPIPKSEIRRENTVVVAEGTSQLFEVYASTALEAKVALNLRWFPGEEEGGAGEVKIPIPLTTRIYEVENGDSVLRSENQLLAGEGGTATASFNRSVPLPTDKLGEKRIRQDRLELVLSPRYQVGRSLSLTLEVTGEVLTLTSDGNLSHPVAHKEDLLLSSGIPSTIELELVSENSDTEGWSKVHFRLEVVAAF